MNNDFAGKNGFYWWQGVVENRMDPLLHGRCRVRILGIHTDNKGGSSIPTNDLPWATPMIPINQEERIVPPKEGTWCFGFYRDGENCQDPVIMGTLPGVIEEGTPNLGKAPTAQNGFFDPVGINSANDLLKTRPLNIEKGFILTPIDNSSTSLRDVGHEEDLRQKNIYPKHGGEPDSHRLTRDEGEFDPRKDQQLLWKIQNAIKKVRTSIVEYIWREPDPLSVYNTLYPFNKVEESESGHVMEVDDTQYFERLHNFHRSGTYDEVQSNGTKMHKTVGDSLFINHLDRKEYTINTERNTVGGSCFRLVMEDQNQICEGDNYYAIWAWPTIYISSVNGDINIKVDGAGTVNIDAPMINLNCGVAQDPPAPNRRPREGKFTNPIPPTEHPHGIPTGQDPPNVEPEIESTTTTTQSSDTTTTTTTQSSDTTTTTTTTGGGSTTRTLNEDGTITTTKNSDTTTTQTNTIAPPEVSTTTTGKAFVDPKTGAVIQPDDIITTPSGKMTAAEYQASLNASSVTGGNSSTRVLNSDGTITTTVHDLNGNTISTSTS